MAKCPYCGGAMPAPKEPAKFKLSPRRRTILKMIAEKGGDGVHVDDLICRFYADHIRTGKLHEAYLGVRVAIHKINRILEKAGAPSRIRCRMSTYRIEGGDVWPSTEPKNYP